MGQGDLANNLANFELANPIIDGEPNFNLANTNEYFANPNIILRKEMRLGEHHFLNFANYRIFIMRNVKMIIFKTNSIEFVV